MRDVRQNKDLSAIARFGAARQSVAVRLALALGLVGSLGQAQTPEPTPGERAGAAAKAFSTELRGTLTAAMTKGGPLAGVEVCHAEAPRIAAAVAEAHGVQLGRVGVRSRQPANRLVGWQQEVLAAWAKAPPAGAPAQWAPVVSKDPTTGTLRWAKAIETEGPCLVCHGDSIEPQLQAAIRARYPDDPATGFAAGSLRGLLWVEVPASTEPPTAEPDQRQSFRLSPAQDAALKAQMRLHLERLEGVQRALAVGDFPAAAALLEQAAGGGHQAGPDDFRPALPEGWRRFAWPMHASFREAASRAAAGDLPGTLGHVGTAMGQCNACHVTYRVVAAAY